MTTFVQDYYTAGYWQGASANYTTAHDMDNAIDGGSGNQDAEFGQRLQSGTYRVFRAWAKFNLTTIPVGSVITSVVIKNRTYALSGSFNVIVVSGAGVTDAVSDFGVLRDSITTLGSIATSGITANVTYDITLNAAGIALAQAAIGGYVTYGFRSDNDIASSAPGASNQIFLDKSGSAGYPVEITVEYSTLTVRTDPATDISSTSAQLNGTLLDDGDNPPITVSFEAGLTVACSDWAGGASTGTEGNPFDAIIDLVAAGIPAGSTVYFRAKATDGTAIAYGSVLSFTLAQYPTVGTTRVSAIVHRWTPGNYTMEVSLGGLGGQFALPYTGKRPAPATEPSAPLVTGPSQADYELWLTNHDIGYILTIFGHFPSYAEWVTWYGGLTHGQLGGGSTNW